MFLSKTIAGIFQMSNGNESVLSLFYSSSSSPWCSSGDTPMTHDSLSHIYQNGSLFFPSSLLHGQCSMSDSWSTA